MHRLIVEINREYTKSEINKQIDIFYDKMKKISEENYELKRTNANLQKEKNKLAYAYARKIGVILTKKEYNRTINGRGRFASSQNVQTKNINNASLEVKNGRN